MTYNTIAHTDNIRDTHTHRHHKRHAHTQTARRTKLTHRHASSHIHIHRHAHARAHTHTTLTLSTRPQKNSSATPHPTAYAGLLGERAAVLLARGLPGVQICRLSECVCTLYKKQNMAL